MTTIDLNKPYCQMHNITDYTVTRRESFGVFDKKGRELGASVATFEGDYVQTAVKVCTSLFMEPFVVDADESVKWVPLQVEPGRFYGFLPCSTRDGAGFGASQSERRFSTAAERDAAVEKYLAGARKRAVKQFGA